MNKIVLKAALIAVGILSAAGILIFSLWILIAPQSMAAVSERLGNYSFAVTCANLKFRYSEKTDDLARCADDSILSGDDELIIKFCGQLKDRSDFLSVCARRDEMLSDTEYGAYAVDYRSYILGNLSAAQYRAGDLEKAVQTAQSGTAQCFSKLVIEVAEGGSAEDKAELRAALSALAPSDYVKELLALLKN